MISAEGILVLAAVFSVLPAVIIVLATHKPQPSSGEPVPRAPSTLDVACPTCKAQPQCYCTYSTGELRMPHLSRIERGYRH